MSQTQNDLSDFPRLEMMGMVGFCGSVPSGLKVHPDGGHIVYSVGSTVVIQEIGNEKNQEFLSLHTNNVTCIAISKSGRYIASGQITYPGFTADIIVWDFHTRRPYARLQLHKVKVEALAFSPNDLYLVSLGGEDDGSVVVWNMQKGHAGDAICGSPAQVQSAGMTHTVAYSNTDDNVFVTCGNGTLRVWKLDVENRKIRPQDVQFGQFRRIVKCVELAADDSFMYCGTTTGDILGINMTSYNFQAVSSEKEKFSRGVTSLALLKNDSLLVGAGDGTVAVVQIKQKEKKFKTTAKVVKVKGAVTSIALRGPGHQFYVGTNMSEIYRFSYSDFKHELLTTCHPSAIHDVAFPEGCDELYATAGDGDVRVWNAHNNQEIMRIVVPNKTCNAIAITQDGKTIVTGWNDGTIKAFYPVSGKTKYTIENAHMGGVTAIATFTHYGEQFILSGGTKGVIRCWRVKESFVGSGKSTFVTSLAFALEEHQAMVSCINVKKDCRECVTASEDGTFIVWDLENHKRKTMIRMNTLYKAACYNPHDDSRDEILTCGTDKKIAFFNVTQGQLLRELEGSNNSIYGLDISPCGNYFVSAGEDKLVKFWDYTSGIETHVGVGHSASIKKVKISPRASYILSVSADGAIIKWKFPRC